ncbi:MAG: ImuA family protein [Planctomycetota bacterium]
MSCSRIASRETVEALRRRLQGFEAQGAERGERTISSGCAALDRLLPGDGFPRGSLIECLGDGPHAGGAGMFAMMMACRAVLAGGVIVVFDDQERFYPPGAAGLGVDLERVVMVRARRDDDRIWALDQALRCLSVAAVWAPIEQLDERAFRRLQLAAEEGGGVGLLIRSRRWRQHPSWAPVRLLITPRGLESRQPRRGRCFRIEVVRCRQGKNRGGVDVEVDLGTGSMHQVSDQHETNTLHSASQLADPATRGRPARAR